MKNFFFFLLILTGLSIQNVSAQKADTFNVVKYKVWVTFIGVDTQAINLRTEQLSLYSTGDSSLVFSNTSRKFYPNKAPMTTTSIEKIWQIKAQKRSNTALGILLGTSVGMVLGGIIGHKTWNPKDKKEKAGYDIIDNDPTFSTIGGVLIGGAYGGTLGGFFLFSKKMTLPIKGDQKTYAVQRAKLKKISITGK